MRSLLALLSLELPRHESSRSKIANGEASLELSLVERVVPHSEMPLDRLLVLLLEVMATLEELEELSLELLEAEVLDLQLAMPWKTLFQVAKGEKVEREERVARVTGASLVWAAKVEKEEKEEKVERAERVLRAFSEAKAAREAKEARERGRMLDVFVAEDEERIFGGILGTLGGGLVGGAVGNAVGSSVGGALGNVVGQQNAGQIVGSVAGALAGASAGANVGNNLGSGLNNLVHGLGGRWNNNNCNGYYGHHGYGYGR